MNENQTKPNTLGRDIAFFAILLALTWLVSCILWVWAHLMPYNVSKSLGNRPYPLLTALVFEYRLLLLLFPTPWLLYAIYSVTKGPRAPHQLVFFSSTLIVALLTVAAIATTAFLMPFVSFHRL